APAPGCGGIQGTPGVRRESSPAAYTSPAWSRNVKRSRGLGGSLGCRAGPVAGLSRYRRKDAPPMTFESIAASPSHAANAAFVDRPGDFTSPSGYNYNDIAGVRGNPHVTQAFIDKVEAISARIGTKPEYLMAVMSFESAQTFSPDVVNRLSGATGLIQFIPPTAQGLGTSTYALSQMSAIEQLDYVEKYFAPYKGERLGTLEGLYTNVLAGRPITDPNATLFDTGDGKAYTQNIGLDANRD